MEDAGYSSYGIYIEVELYLHNVLLVTDLVS